MGRRFSPSACLQGKSALAVEHRVNQNDIKWVNSPEDPRKATSPQCLLMLEGWGETPIPRQGSELRQRCSLVSHSGLVHSYLKPALGDKTPPARLSPQAEPQHSSVKAMVPRQVQQLELGPGLALQGCQ